MQQALRAPKQPAVDDTLGVAPGTSRAFLRWAGGKQHLLPEILLRLRSPIVGGKYIEPFLGAASVFLSTAPRSALVGDLNYHLIGCYRELVTNPDRVSKELRRLARVTRGARGYYALRREYNASRPSATQAARFILLNKLCFNGIFRVNLQGEFNVPYGRKYEPALPSAVELASAAEVLSRATVRVAGYEELLAEANAGDSIFLDPPYPPSSRTAYFAHYTTSRFSDFDQRRLAHMVRELDGSGVKIMMTNADCELIRRLYSYLNISIFTVPRWVSCQSTKPRAGEVIITNYDDARP